MTTAAPKPNLKPVPAGPLAAIRRGKLTLPHRLVMMGVEGVGKSTFAAGAPNPIFLTADAGTAHLDIARLPEPRTWGEAIDAIRALQSEPHDFKTFVVDSVTWLEPLLHAKVCADNKWSSIEDPGYGKGYLAALEHWRVLVSELEQLWSRRAMNVILLAHCTVKLFKNPEGEDFERYQMSLNEKAAGLIRQWSDAVLFARHEAFAKRDAATKRVRGYSTGARVIHTTWSAAFDAKNRFNLPEEIPLSWAAFDEAVRANGPERANALRQQIEAQLAELGDETVTAKARAYVAEAAENVTLLAEVANAVAMKLAEKVNSETKEQST